jgi:hypothetical protein
MAQHTSNIVEEIFGDGNAYIMLLMRKPVTVGSPASKIPW